MEAIGNKIVFNTVKYFIFISVAQIQRWALQSLDFFHSNYQYYKWIDYKQSTRF